MAIKVKTPGIRGEYRLRITLVQDGHFWFDDLVPNSFAEVDVLIEDR